MRSRRTRSSSPIELYEWDWDYDGVTFDADPNAPDESTATHVHNTVGTYTAAVRVTESVTNGITLQAIAVATIVPQLAPKAWLASKAKKPIPDIPLERDPYAPFEFVFDGSASADEDGTIESWELDFGDGKTETGTGVPGEFDHTYTLKEGETSAGFTISLTVTDDDGLTDTAYVELRCGEPAEPPAPYRARRTVAFVLSSAVLRSTSGGWAAG